MEKYKKKFINKNKLQEAGISYQLLDHEGYWHKVSPHIDALSKIIDYDIDLARSICIHLLQDVNDHAMSAKLDMLFSRDMQ